MRTRLLALLLILNLPQAWAQIALAPQRIDGVEHLNAEQVVALILKQEALVIIDARRHEEYAKGHIEGATHLFEATMAPETLARHVPHPDTPLLFYCNGVQCLRSSNAAIKARDWGYRNIYWFRGGWNEWRDNQLPVAR